MAELSPATIRISNLRLRTIIGANEWERTRQQDVILNLAFRFDAAEAARSDAVEDTLDYKKIKHMVIDTVENSSFMLLERLCAEVLSAMMAMPRVTAATVKIDKPHALRFADSVSVEMSAER